MEAKFINGSTVSRVWGRNEEAELLAAFQYETDAMDFARSKLTEDQKHDTLRNCSYVVASHCTGKVVFLSPPLAEAAE